MADGVEDLDYAIALAPESPDVRWVVADAYTYCASHVSEALPDTFGHWVSS